MNEIESKCIHCDICRWFETRVQVPKVATSHAPGKPATSQPKQTKRRKGAYRRTKTDVSALLVENDGDVLIARNLLRKKQTAGQLSPTNAEFVGSLNHQRVGSMPLETRERILSVLRETSK